MTLDEITRTAVEPALAWLPPKMTSPEAKVEMLSICLKESLLKHRRQVTNSGKEDGPAVSFWQFERGGGITGVLTHCASSALAHQFCGERGIDASPMDVWVGMQTDDVLGAVFARLLLWTEPGALPRVTDTEAAWQLYLRAWRPGAYTRGTPQKRVQLRAEWEGHHRAVRAFLRLP
jgi:hypothetical protein